MELENVEDALPLSPTQAGMLFHCIAEPGSGVYINKISLTLKGEFHYSSWLEAWRQVVQRHTVLRSAFVWDGVDEPLQIIFQQLDIIIQQKDCSAMSDSELADAMQTLRRNASIDLTQAPLMRFYVLQVDQQCHELLWVFHHLLMDGWSARQVLNEVMQLYQAAAQGVLADLAVVQPWDNFVNWLQNRDDSGDRRFWQDYLLGFAEPTELLLPSVSLQQELTVDSLMTKDVIPAALSRQLVGLARELRITLSTLMHAAWGLLMQHYSGQQDVVFGSTVSGRPHDLDGVEEIVGLFINTLPVRLQIEDDCTVKQWLQTLQQNLLAIKRYQNTPLNKIQGWSDAPKGRALFDSIVVFENFPAREETLENSLLIESIEYFEQSNYPLALLIVPESAIELILVHQSGRYPQQIAEQLLRHYQNLLKAIPDYLAQSPLAVPMINSAELVLLEQWNQTQRNIDSSQLIHQQIAAQAKTQPDAIAVAAGDTAISYAELERLSTAWAITLLERGVEPGCHVALCFQRNSMMIIAMLATLKAGCAYLPLDAHYPHDRLLEQLNDSAAQLLFTDAESYAVGNGLSIPVINIEKDAPIANPECAFPRVSDAMPAYIIYTSGSSGKPKGVQISHRNLLNSNNARINYYLRQPETFLLLSSFSFDSSVAGIFWTLSQGGMLLIADFRIEQRLDRLAGLIERHQVTHTLCLPTLYHLMLENMAAKQLNSLAVVIVAGEAFPANDLLAMHRQKLSQADLYNEYGPTEATVWATVFDTKALPLNAIAPIGKPVDNTHIVILDLQGRQCPIGLPGEIYIGGESVADGYFGDKEESEIRFVSLPGMAGSWYRTGDWGYFQADGNIVFQGRHDQQVKIRGHRIETAEIEKAIMLSPEVEDVIVIATADNKQQEDPAQLDDGRLEKLAWSLMAMGDDEAEKLFLEIESLSDSNSG